MDNRCQIETASLPGGEGGGGGRGAAEKLAAEAFEVAPGSDIYHRAIILIRIMLGISPPPGPEGGRSCRGPHPAARP